VARVSAGLLLSALAVAAMAQEVEAKGSSGTKDPAPGAAAAVTSEVSGVPGNSAAIHGWNAGVSVAGVHDSTTGWAVLWNPLVGYSFNEVFSVEATVPIYSYRLAETLAVKPKPNAELVPLRAELGDVVLALHAQLAPKLFEYQVTGAVQAPTGDELYGLTTGRVTFDIDNRFERTLGRWTPSLSAGGGDTSTLVNRIVTKNYTSLGPLAHFEVGVAVDLGRNLSFESDAYEQLPIGDQKIYGPSRKGGPTVVIGHHVSEDNGFTNSLEVPLDRRTTLSAYYNRSLRLHEDSVGFSLTYLLRAPPPEDGVDDLLH
jgi:hypothetical protein